MLIPVFSNYSLQCLQKKAITIRIFVQKSPRNQRAHQVISEKLLSKEFHCRTTDHK